VCACRYAREIAQLKTKLAEKDAQLLGGFGSLDHLTFGQSTSATSGPLAAAGLGDFPQSHDFSPGAFGFGAFAAGLPTLHELGQIPGLPGPAIQAVAPAGAVGSWTMGSGAAGRLSSGSRGQGGGGANTLLATSPAASAAAAGRSLPKLPDALHSGNRGQQPNGLAMAASRDEAAAVGFPGSGSASGRGFAQQGSYTLRAGSAEARLMHQGTGGATSPQGSPGRLSKPRSPLLPTGRQQQRLTNSADGVRGPGLGMSGSMRGTGSPSQQQHSPVARAAPSSQQAWASSSLPQQQQQAVPSQPLSGSEYEGGYGP
jgi:hypothetical protein